MVIATKDALKDALGIKSIVSDRKLHTIAAKTAERMSQIEEVLHDVAPQFEPEIRPLSGVTSKEDLEVSSEVWAERVANKLFSDTVGQVTQEDDIAMVTFYETERDRGFVNREIRRIKHTHRVHRPKFRKLPATYIKVPPKGQVILAKLEAAGLKRHVRILTGQLIGEQVVVDKRHTERTQLGKGLDKFNAVSRAAAKGVAIAAGAVGAGALAVVASPLVLAGGAMSAIAAGDPAICIGNTVFFAWVD